MLFYKNFMFHFHLILAPSYCVDPLPDSNAECVMQFKEGAFSGGEIVYGK